MCVCLRVCVYVCACSILPANVRHRIFNLKTFYTVISNVSVLQKDDLISAYQIGKITVISSAYIV